MDNAQEAIKDYEKKMQRHGRVNIIKAKLPNPAKAVTMILDHEYSDNGDIKYLAQRKDRKQRWVLNPDERWTNLLNEYWYNASDEGEPPVGDEG